MRPACEIQTVPRFSSLNPLVCVDEAKVGRLLAGEIGNREQRITELVIDDQAIPIGGMSM